VERGDFGFAVGVFGNEETEESETEIGSDYIHI